MSSKISGLVSNARDEVLLIRSPRRGWEFPGGQVEKGESLLQALERETHEETGTRITVGRLVGVYTNLAPKSMKSARVKLSHGNTIRHTTSIVFQIMIWKSKTAKPAKKAQRAQRNSNSLSEYLYNCDPKEVTAGVPWFLKPEYHYYTLWNEDAELSGFLCFGEDAISLYLPFLLYNL